MKQDDFKNRLDQKKENGVLICPACKEKNNPTFTQCWKCGLDFATGEMHLPSRKEKMKPWKVYFWFMVASNAGFLWKVISRPTLMYAIDAAFNALTLVALYGFCFNRKLGFQKYWKVAFFIAVIQAVFFSMKEIFSEMIRLDLSAVIVGVIIGLALIVPIYVAMYLYAFKSDDIWKEGIASQK